MSRPEHHVVITGASGFLGEAALRDVLRHPRFASSRVTATDIAASAPIDDPRVRWVLGDIGEPHVLNDVIGERADVVLHLAGILGAAAEADYDLARRVNLDASLRLFERVRDASAPPRVVFASAAAVFGPGARSPITDASIPKPLLTYGAQKLMVEVALDQFSARGGIDGLALRFPGVVARRDADARQTTAFLNRLFHAHADNENLELPVRSDGHIWLLSVVRAAAAVTHAATLPPELLTGSSRALNLPALRVTYAALVEALARKHPQSSARISYRPIEAIDAQFARFPELHTPNAESLGFEHDGDIGRLIENAVASAP